MLGFTYLSLSSNTEAQQRCMDVESLGCRGIYSFRSCVCCLSRSFLFPPSSLCELDNVRTAINTSVRVDQVARNRGGHNHQLQMVLLTSFATANRVGRINGY